MCVCDCVCGRSRRCGNVRAILARGEKGGAFRERGEREVEGERERNRNNSRVRVDGSELDVVHLNFSRNHILWKHQSI